MPPRNTGSFDENRFATPTGSTVALASSDVVTMPILLKSAPITGNGSTSGRLIATPKVGLVMVGHSNEKPAMLADPVRPLGWPIGRVLRLEVW